MTSDVRVTFNQDVWWSSADGLTHLIDDLDDRYRANIAGWLVKNAAAFHLKVRMRHIRGNFWAYVHAGQEAFERGSWGPVVEDPPSYEDMAGEIRKEQDRGEHLDWIRGTVLFRRMIRDLPESSLPPGTVRPASEAAKTDFS